MDRHGRRSRIAVRSGNFYGFERVQGPKKLLVAHPASFAEPRMYYFDEQFHRDEEPELTSDMRPFHQHAKVEPLVPGSDWSSPTRTR